MAVMKILDANRATVVWRCAPQFTKHTGGTLHVVDGTRTHAWQKSIIVAYAKRSLLARLSTIPGNGFDNERRCTRSHHVRSCTDFMSSPQHSAREGKDATPEQLLIAAAMNQSSTEHGAVFRRFANEGLQYGLAIISDPPNEWLASQSMLSSARLPWATAYRLRLGAEVARRLRPLIYVLLSPNDVMMTAEEALC
ncbi:hypothetical protein [Mycobacterium kubicae]|uniref:Uncharacterized protein n=1 Tax=Mycobacterium kubicae TaxID=120959 RepID=A0AAX1J746_9MYCO|nr:hypothetical protein [Mycobacterium kubicae]MCV7093573.1 hypothetical protein [Mycobacterium kubicae]QNI12816.1 hypothetical protein GAN18_17950 [Mycobacterium kubicae]QPI36327.1 hypothetical protein I2456_17650 [Mycobacterium kubicae]